MTPKRGQNYTERVNKRRRATDRSATSDSMVRPHPSRLQLVQMQEPTNAAQATTQLTLLAEVLATLTNSISAAVSEALLNVAQPRQSAAAAATTFPDAHPSTSVAAAALPEVQFFPDPISISSSEVNRGSGVVEANPTTTNADRTQHRQQCSAASHKFLTIWCSTSKSTNSEQCRRARTQHQPRCHHTFYQRTGR